MGKYWIIAYVLNGEIEFYRTTSKKRLVEKTEQLKKEGCVYNTLVASGWNITFIRG